MSLSLPEETFPEQVEPWHVGGALEMLAATVANPGPDLILLKSPESVSNPIHQGLVVSCPLRALSLHPPNGCLPAARGLPRGRLALGGGVAEI